MSEEATVVRFDRILPVLRRACAEKRSGTLSLAPADGRKAHLSLAAGEIVGASIGPKRGCDALLPIKNIGPSRYEFDEAAPPERGPDLPPTPEVLAILGAAPSDSAPSGPGPRAIDPTEIRRLLEAEMEAYLGPGARAVCEERIARAGALTDPDELRRLLDGLAALFPDPAQADAFRHAFGGRVFLNRKSTLETVMESMAQAILIADADLRVVVCNRNFEPLFGFAPGEISRGESIDALIRIWAARTGIGAAQLEKVLRAARKTEPFLSEYRQRIGNGPSTWIQLFHSPLPGGGFTRTYTDVTEKKRAEVFREAAFRISEAADSTSSLDTFLHRAHEIIGTMIPAGNLYVALLDERGETISFPYFVDEEDCRPAPKSLGRGLTEYVIRSAEPLLASPEVFSDLVSRGEVETIGAPSIDWLGAPLKASGKTIGAIVVQSYTPGVRFGASDRDFLSFISNQVAMSIERRRGDEALRAAMEAAEAASISKSQFLANMSHEIRTPMNGVLGMTGLLLDSNLTEEQRRFAEVVRSSAEGLLTVINDVLDFSKIEAGKLELEDLDFDLRLMLEDVAEILALRAQEKGLELICRVEPEMPTALRGDPGRLRQVLVNLAGNAIKFTSRGEVFIEVRPGVRAERRIEARFEVRDTGIGIPAEKLGELFTAFQQVDASTTRRFGGTGLGLAISRRLAALMGGQTGVSSVEGKGSTFWFTAVLGEQEHRAPLERADVRGSRILIVDDNATNRLVLSEQLRSWGVRHEEANDVPQALRMLRAAREEDPFRIVLSDMQMPDMDGEALGRTVKADPELHSTILVMMTSIGVRGDAKRLEEIGFAAYLTKPVKQSQLHDCLATVLGRSLRTKGVELAPLVTRHTLSEARKRNVRILLADDNTTNQNVGLRILEKLGFRADTVANGLEAIQALETLPYDLVFMDVQMPVMDGFEATRAIRSGATRVLNPRIPVIAMTAHAMKGDRERCLEAGMDDYVSKPIVPGQLVETLERWLPIREELPHPSPIHVPASPAPRDLPVFERAGFVDRLMGDEGLAKEIAAGFLEEMPPLLSSLAEALRRGDVASAGRVSHGIKGAGANVGAMAMSAVAAELEAAAEAGRAEKAAALLPDLEQQFALLERRMKETFP